MLSALHQFKIIHDIPNIVLRRLDFVRLAEEKKNTFWLISQRLSRIEPMSLHNTTINV